MLERALEISCPACGEPTSIWLTAPEGRHEEASDCQVCCRPFHVVVQVSRGELTVLEVSPGW